MIHQIDGMKINVPQLEELVWGKALVTYQFPVVWIAPVADRQYRTRKCQGRSSMHKLDS